ncbi:MAG: methionyl-tRNA formyltransferase [Bacillota bacterium]
MDKKIRTIFMGTPEFAVLGLKALIEAEEFEVVAAFTQPDKPFGRKQILTPPPIKVLASEHGIPVLQPEKIKPETNSIAALKPDLIVVIAYGKIIPQSILDIPAYGCINVHASLLPKYRGASCLQAPILNGDSETGVTIMRMDAGLDTGPILKQARIPLNGRETLEEVHDRLSSLGAEILIPTLLGYCQGDIKPQTQDDSQATYIGLMHKEDGYLNPKKDAIVLERQVRALYPWPGTYLELESGEKIKVLKCEVLNENYGKIGEFTERNGALILNCGQNALHILKLQRENRNALDASDFLKGSKDILGQTAK